MLPKTTEAVTIYHVLDGDHGDAYYWCCNACGACSKHHRDIVITAEEAAKHYEEFN